MADRNSTRSSNDAGASLLVIAQRQWRVAGGVLVLCLLMGAAYLIVARREYTATARVRVEQVGPRAIGEQPQASPEIINSFLSTEGEVLTSAPVLAIALSNLKGGENSLIASQANPIEYLKKNVRVSVGRKHQLITLDYDAPSREESIATLKAVVDAYAAFHGKRTKERSDKLVGAIELQKVNCLNTLKDINEKILMVKAKAGTASFDNDKDNNARQQLAKLNDALTAARLDTRAAKLARDEAVASYGNDPQRLAELDQIRNAHGPATPTDLDYSQTRQSILEVERQLNVVRREYTPAHPMYQQLEKRLDVLRAIYVVASERRWAAAVQTEQDLDAAFKAQQSAASEYAKLAAEAANLERERNRLEGEATKLEQRITELRVETAAGPLNIQVQEEADAPQRPTKPAATRTMAIALVLGVVLALAVAAARHRIQPRLYAVEDVSNLLGLPVLGVVPRGGPHHSDSTRAQVARLDQTSEMSEAFRTIRLSLQFRAANGVMRTLLITAPSVGQGSSMISSNLAITLARAGKRVLLVDANFEQPTQHALWGCDNGMGLGTVLEGADSLENAVAGTAVDGLSLLTSGPAPADALDALNGERFTELLAQMGKRYDHVVIDAPPAGTSNDARVMAASVDGVLLVLRAGKSARQLSEQACDGILSVGGRLVGAVLNDSTARPPASSLRGENEPAAAPRAAASNV